MIKLAEANREKTYVASAKASTKVSAIAECRGEFQWLFFYKCLNFSETRDSYQKSGLCLENVLYISLVFAKMSLRVLEDENLQ